MSHWERCQLDLWTGTAEWEEFVSRPCKLSAAVFDGRYLRSDSKWQFIYRWVIPVMLWTCTFIKPHTLPFPKSLKDSNKLMVCWQWGLEELEGCTELRTQSCCCCKTGQTGLRRAKRHSEGKREQHWAISSQSGRTGLMGGRGRSHHGHISIPQWLTGWHESGEAIFFLFFSLLSPQNP